MKARSLAVTAAMLFYSTLFLFADKIGPGPGPQSDPPSLCNSISGNLVANCGFETGNFSSWTRSGNLGFTGVSGGYAHTGNYGAQLGPIGSDGFLSQNINTIAGHSYVLQWWLFSDGGFPNNFDVSLNGVEVFFLPYVAAQPYTEYTLDFIATGATALQFSFRNDPGYLGLDDISVVPNTATTIPEPGSLLLFGSGLLAGAASLRRKLLLRA